MITVDLLEPVPSKPEQSIDLIKKDLLPLYAEFWQKVAQPQYDRPWNMHVALFLELWFGGGLRCVIAKENGRAVGFAVCIIFRPLQFEASVLQIHDMYAPDANVEREMWQYIDNLAKILNCNELWLDKSCRLNPQLSHKWNMKAPTTIERYVKE